MHLPISTLDPSAAPEPARTFHPRTHLARKLLNHLNLSQTECDIVARALAIDVRSVRHRTILLEAGAAATKLGVMVSGWASRYKPLAGGGRQVVAFYLPGDVCDFNVFMAPAIDSTIELQPGASVAGLSRAQLGLLNRSQPRITRGLWWESQAAASVQREWMVNVTQRNARQRVAHLICEIVTRLAAVGLAEGRACDVPLTQSDFGSACGMTGAHTNRMLRELRDAGLASWRGRRLEVENWHGLSELAGFDPAYLQLRPAIGDENAAAGAETRQD